MKSHRVSNRKTQRDHILRILIEARGAWVPLPEITACAAQYNARLYELRHDLGFAIENRTEVHPETGARHSWFRLAQAVIPQKVEAPAITPNTASGCDWFETATGGPRPKANSGGASELPLFSAVDGDPAREAR